MLNIDLELLQHLLGIYNMPLCRFMRVIRHGNHMARFLGDLPLAD